MSPTAGCIDEHGLRSILLDAAHDAQRAYAHVIVTLADQAADLRGLYASDFDLLTRAAGIARIDVVATESVLAAGFHERIHGLLPGLEEERSGEPGQPPVLVVPETADAGQRWFVCRDREEELADLVRWLASPKVGLDVVTRSTRFARPDRRGLPAAVALPVPGAPGVRRRRRALAGARRAAAVGGAVCGNH